MGGNFRGLSERGHFLGQNKKKYTKELVEGDRRAGVNVFARGPGGVAADIERHCRVPEHFSWQFRWGAVHIMSYNPLRISFVNRHASCLLWHCLSAPLRA